jgi:hypothetical protein
VTYVIVIPGAETAKERLRGAVGLGVIENDLIAGNREARVRGRKANLRYKNPFPFEMCVGEPM